MLDPKFMKAMALYGALGFELAATIVGCLVGGYFLDQHFGKSPWFIIVGLFLGLGIGGYRMAQTIRLLSEDKDLQ